MAERIDPRPGVHQNSLKWAVVALYSTRPGAEKLFEDFTHWPNAMSALATAFVRAGVAMSELSHLETADSSFFLGTPVSP